MVTSRVSARSRGRAFPIPRFPFGGYVAGLSSWSRLDPDEIRRAIGVPPDAASLAARVKHARYERGRFHNLEPTQLALRGHRLRVVRDLLFGPEVRVPASPLPHVPRTQDELALPSRGGLRATWLGHSSVLLEIEGHRILTDPVFAERIGPSPSVFGASRFHGLPIAPLDLPPLDAIVISHDHYDHLDLPTIVELASRGERIVTPLGVGSHLRAWGVPGEQIVELDWWGHAKVRDLTITAVPARHFSGRGPNDRMATLWASFVFAGREKRVFFSGDTGYHGAFRTIGERLGPFDLVMLEVGAYHPSWWQIHLGPDNARRAFEELGGRFFLPIHWGTFMLGMHDWWQPAERVRELFAGGGRRVATPRVGEITEPGHVEPDDPWWRPLAGPGGAARRTG